MLALALGAAGLEGFVAAELAPEWTLDRAAGVKLIAVGLNLNSLAFGFSFDAGAVDGLASLASPCNTDNQSFPVLQNLLSHMYASLETQKPSLLYK